MAVAKGTKDRLVKMLRAIPGTAAVTARDETGVLWEVLASRVRAYEETDGEHKGLLVLLVGVPTDEDRPEAEVRNWHVEDVRRSDFEYDVKSGRVLLSITTPIPGAHDESLVLNMPKARAVADRMMTDAMRYEERSEL